MAIKELALITEARNRKKKKQKEITPTINKPRKEVIKNKKGTNYINRDKISTKPGTKQTVQKTSQNRILTNKERLTSQPTISSVKKDIRTVKTTKKSKPTKKYQTSVYDIYERDGNYYFHDGKKENQIDRDFVQRAIQNKKTGVIGNYNSKGKLNATDSKGNVLAKEKNIFKNVKRLYQGAKVGASLGARDIAISDLQEAQNDLNKGEKIKRKDLPKQVLKALWHSNPFMGQQAASQEAGKNIKKIWKDDKKNLWQKGVGTASEIAQAGTHGQKQAAKDVLQALGSVDTSADEKAEKLQNKISESSEKMEKAYEKDKDKYYSGINELSDTNKAVGYMLPAAGVAAATKNPRLGLIMMAKAAKGGATKRALEAGRPIDEAVKIGTLTGDIEYGTELISGGLRIFGKGPLGKWANVGGVLDKFSDTTINRLIRNKGANFITKQGLGVAGEYGEELLSDLAGVAIDRGTIDPNAKYTPKDALETFKTTVGATTIMNAITGGYSPKAYINNKIEMQTQEVNERVDSGEISAEKGLSLLEQVKKGTYEQNKRLDQIANQKSAEIQEAVINGQMTPQQGVQEMQTLDRTLTSERKRIDNEETYTVRLKRDVLKIAEEMAKDPSVTRKQFVKEWYSKQGEQEFGITKQDVENLYDNVRKPKTQETQNLATATSQTTEEINKSQDNIQQETNPYEEMRNELRNENTNVTTQETTSNQQKSTQKKKFNNELADFINSETDSNKAEMSDFFKDRTTDYDKNQGYVADGKLNVFRFKKGNNEAKLSITENENEIWIDELYIKNQKQGYGKEIVDAIKKYAYEKGKEIRTFKEVGSARKFWDKMFGEETSKGGFSHSYIKHKPEYWQKRIDDTQEQIERFSKWKENALEQGKEDLANNHQEGIDWAKKRLEEYKTEYEKSKQEIGQNENIPATKNENVISEEVKPQTQETTNENVNQESKTEQVETQQESKGPEILDKMPVEEKKSIFKKLKEKYNAFRHHFTDHREAWYDLSRETRNPDINSRADAIDLANGKAQVDIGRAQIDYNGKRYKNFTNYEEIAKLNKQIENIQKNNSITEKQKEKQIEKLNKEIEKNKNTDMSFESAYDLYNKIPVKAKNEFLVHNLNIDRLNQGVDQFEITLQESQAKLKELREKYPDIDNWSENIYQYYRNLAQKLVDGGRLPQSKVNEWWETTPHYVHIQRDMGQKGNSGVDTKNGKIDSDRLIQKVKGGNYPILPIKQISADFTRNSIEALQINNLGKELLKTVGVGSRADGTQQINDMDDIFGINQDLIKDDGKGNYTFVIYDKGNAIEVPITKDMYEGLKPRDIRNLPTSKVVKFQREIITNKNPVFSFLRNPVKDFQAMFLYSKHPFNKSLSTYKKLFTERTVLKNEPFSKEEGTMPQEIVELYYDQGNQANSFYHNGEFESEKTKNKLVEGVDKVLSPIEKGGNFMESMPRITEFWNTVQEEGYTVRNGDVISRKEAIRQQAEEDFKNKEITKKEYDARLKKAKKMKTPTKSIEQVLMEASHDSAEITVNFKRGGTWGKNLDKNFAVYSSPAIQGAAKFGRTVTEAVGDAKHGDFKAARRLVTRAATLGVAPALLSAAMYGDDDDYKDIQDYQKDQYYLIKGPNGKWIRIPKGREISTIQSFTRRSMDKAKGEKDAFKGYGSFAINQVGPTNPLESNFASPLISAFITNRSWSGNPIVSKYMKDNVAEEDQFNEKTDELSKWIGKQTGISPMKINYILDQYSGGLGDVALPYITPKAANNAKNPVESIFKNEFTFDQANSSKSVNKFYDTKNKINKAFKKRNATDEDKAKKVYFGTISQSLYGLTTKKRDIQMDKNLSKKEKYEKALDIQKKMNKLTSDAVKNLDTLKVDKNTATIGGVLYYKNKNSKYGWSQESEKTTKNREKLGLSPEKYYYYKNEESYTPPGGEKSTSITSGKNAKYNIAMVDAFKFDPSDYLEYKNKLSKIRGDKDSRGRTIRYTARNKKLKYLNSLPISSVEKAYLMKQNDKYYKGSDYNLKKAISNSSLSNKEKKELYSYLGLGR